MGGLLRAVVLAFLSGGAVMVAEIAAPRLLARHLGTNVLVWAVTIATFLGGLALGNAAGGRLADRGRAWTGSLLFLASAAALAAAVPVDAWAASAGLGSLGHGLRVLLFVPLAFLPAAFLLGAISPVLARAALAAGGPPGRTLGLVGAGGAAGSVLGTFLAGFVFVPAFGTRAILLGTAGALAACAALAFGVGAGRRRAAGRPPVSAPLGWTALAAFAGAVILALEIAAGRVAADRMGNSVYTWTSVIGVVLAGIVVGNTVGGRLADRIDARRLLGGVLVLGAVGVASCLWTPNLMRPALGLDGLPWPLRTLLAGAAAFFVPCAILGAITPVVIRAALADPETDGRCVGRLYAAGSAGAVLGAALTGFLLVPGLGLEGLFLVLAIGLTLAARRVRGRLETPLAFTLLALLALAWLPGDAVRSVGLRLGLRQDAEGALVRDSRYFRIRVRPTERRAVRLTAAPAAPIDASLEAAEYDEVRRMLAWYGPMTEDEAARLRTRMANDEDRDAVDVLLARTSHRVHELSLDKLVHGYVDLDDPDWLGYDYEEIYAALTRRLVPDSGEVRAFFVGGGSYTFQRWLLRLGGERARLWTAEIDPAVTRAAKDGLGFVEDSRHVVRHEDARTALDGVPGSLDLVYGDAFNDLTVPFHLTTVEFARALEARMEPSGAYLLNVVDSFSSGRFLGAVLCTLEAVFPEVRIVSSAPRVDDGQETFVLVASRRPVPLEDLRDGGGRPLAVTSYGPDDLALLRRRAGGLVLTDDHAPVEILLAPVVEKRGPP